MKSAFSKVEIVFYLKQAKAIGQKKHMQLLVGEMGHMDTQNRFGLPARTVFVQVDPETRKCLSTWRIGYP